MDEWVWKAHRWLLVCGLGAERGWRLAVLVGLCVADDGMASPGGLGAS